MRGRLPPTPALRETISREVSSDTPISWLTALCLTTRNQPSLAPLTGPDKLKSLPVVDLFEDAFPGLRD